MSRVWLVCLGSGLLLFGVTIGKSARKPDPTAYTRGYAAAVDSVRSAVAWADTIRWLGYHPGDLVMLRDGDGHVYIAPRYSIKEVRP